MMCAVDNSCGRLELRFVALKVVSREVAAIYSVYSLRN